MTSVPRVASGLLARLLPPALREDALLELAELHARRVSRDGRRRADRWYRRQIVPFALRVWWDVLAHGSLGPVAPQRTRWRSEPMRTLLSDLRHALRSLLRAPGFTLVALLTLALGIGANTAIFSVVHAVLLRPLPFAQPDRLVSLSETRLDRGWTQASFTHANFWDVQEQSRTFDGIAAFRVNTMSLTGRDQPRRVRAGLVSANFFQVLGVRAVSGRLFASHEDSPGADTKLVLLGNDFWRTELGADNAIVGRRLTLDGTGYTVIGVLPAGGSWLDEADLFVPMVHEASANRGSFELAVIGRLKPAVTVAAAREDLGRIARQLAAAFPDDDRGMGIALDSSADWVASDSLRRALWVLMGAVGLLLLIACVNLANLLLARATNRTREHAVRSALGAGRGRLMGLLLTESLVLGVLGAAAGLGLAALCIQLLRHYNPGGIPRLAYVSIDGVVLAFSAFAALLTAAVAGLGPAWRGPHYSVATALRETERSVAGHRRQNRLRGLLVGAEVALSLMLLVGAGLLIRSFTRLLRVERGFATENRMVMEVPLPPFDGPDTPEAGRAWAGRVTQFMNQYLERIRAMPQVASAAAVSWRPLNGVGTGMGFAAADKPVPAGSAVPWASWRDITRDYFRTMGAAIVAGRDFTEQDLIGEPWRVIISQRLAQTLWPGENAVGRTMLLWKGQGDRPAEVIGVAADMRDWGLDGDRSLAVYIPYYMGGFSPAQFVIHANVPPVTLMPALRAALHALQPDLPISNVRTFDDLIGESVASRRFTMLLLAALAGLALVLALAGVYGVLSYSVSRRRSEIGMRIALGASRGSVLRLIIVQGMRPVIVGLFIGIAGALLLSRLMTSLLFGVTAVDALTYGGVATLLLLCAVLSCWVPARSALRLDVIAALREE